MIVWNMRARRPLPLRSTKSWWNRSSAFVVGPNSFQALRFLLGVAEAGFFQA